MGAYDRIALTLFTPHSADPGGLPPNLGLTIKPNPKLSLDGLAERHEGLTEAIAECYSEAARVCLDRHHQSPVDLEIERDGTLIVASTEWQKADQRMLRAWANAIDTTEAGAYAYTLAAIELSQGLVAVRRAETKTGADYYVAPIGTSPEDFENCIRLEVSGIDKGGKNSVRERLQQKVEQALRGESNLPAIAGVVGFGSLKIIFSPVNSNV